MRHPRHATTLLLLVGTVLFALALPGATEPTCQPVTPGEPACLTPADCEGLAHVTCVGEWQCVDAACAWECRVTDPGCYSDADCAAGQDCTADTLCLPPPDCPMCTVCWGRCVDVPPACGTDGGTGACADPNLTCQCRPPAGCPLCDVCAFGCYPADGKCRSDADCVLGDTCDFKGTPDYCPLIMAPTLPPACWGTCAPCNAICPAVMCPVGQIMDPCTCKCLGGSTL